MCQWEGRGRTVGWPFFIAQWSLGEWGGGGGRSGKRLKGWLGQGRGSTRRIVLLRPLGAKKARNRPGEKRKEIFGQCVGGGGGGGGRYSGVYSMVVREGRQAVFVTVPPFLSLSLSCAGGYFSGLSVDRMEEKPSALSQIRGRAKNNPSAPSQRPRFDGRAEGEGRKRGFPSTYSCSLFSGNTKWREGRGMKGKGFGQVQLLRGGGYEREKARGVGDSRPILTQRARRK